MTSTDEAPSPTTLCLPRIGQTYLEGRALETETYEV